MRQLIKVFKTLSDETKVRILKILQERDELCVCEIMQVLDISQSRASRNLGILKDAGFVIDRRDGLWIHYSINKKKINEYHEALNELLKNWLNDEGIIREDRKRLRKAVKLSLRSKCK
ncbi:MAG: transcriptional regulator [bacterium (Candidatus Ratteibacteria) CG_4_9_14_3_um_filter_41_21]|uniref:Transcriptional regulator n=3 Tax=Candidatus Ratteibacteria TaxID=2979319 RepID=A0A2M7YGC5_9BACT|nr:MAG: transcriptional regulator [bacterium (Candidatus Ratteibacteria) CG01_land_8_20_14_3_00_40_19]PIW33505.1 MAG: transcriptional regulator [bacterium (Candidatus Ratteibacteria) CG15_BIG_FIL_POST_REV_8_21_14_020_41_12]PJA62019.1 MAG: transcriptional regulator [bacterium (Candidatus Ratteibacteria) CG_4_9_14_3_um_filter_41_21]HCG76733.1 transcriptional regulator [bacterium]